MYQSVVKWLERVAFVRIGGKVAPVPNEQLLLGAEQSLHISLSWGQGRNSAYNSLLAAIKRDGDMGLDILDFIVSQRNVEAAQHLDDILTKAGSGWEVVPATPPRNFQLVRRSIGPVREAIDSILPVSERAHAHLVTAWNKLMGRSPDPSSAYREAIRAVEVVAAPVITPDDRLATLGKIIKALHDKPEKWTVDLAEAKPEQVTEMGAMIWQSQFDRHGTHDDSVPLNVSQEQADAAVHVAIALTRLFAGGHIRHA
jgi:hypothetical protein